MKLNNLKLSIFLFIVSICSLQSCMQWNGDIGEWFGSWHLESIYIDGKLDESYKSNVMISFQGKIINFGYLETGAILGSWEYNHSTLTLIAGYQAGSGASMPQLFDPFPVCMYFTPDEDVVQVNVSDMNKHKMQWQYVDAQGRVITYNFKKYP